MMGWRMARRLCWWVTVWVWMLVGVGMAWGQNAPSDYTLRVYVNTAQVPVLVLGANRQRLSAPVAADRFRISLDNGPWFRSTHVRQEGEDPIALGVLLDPNSSVKVLMPKMGEALAALASGSLGARDRVSVYAMDCKVIRLVRDVPADPARLRAAVDDTLRTWRERTAQREKGCGDPGLLWDSLGFVIGDVAKMPGRRVVFAITDGRDKGSRNKWNAVRFYAQETGVAVFGMTWTSYMELRFPSTSHQVVEKPFWSVCELSGGMVQTTSTDDMEPTLEHTMKMVRERYIVEFPRASNVTAGSHLLDVQVTGAPEYFVRAAGDSMPLPDPAELSDPNTVKGDPDKAPQQGKRRVLAPQE